VHSVSPDRPADFVGQLRAFFAKETKKKLRAVAVLPEGDPYFKSRTYKACKDGLRELHEIQSSQSTK